MSRREQERARRCLRRLALIEERRQPNAPMRFRLDFERLYTLLEVAAMGANHHRGGPRR